MLRTVLLGGVWAGVEPLVPAAGNEECYSWINCRLLHCICPVDAPGLSRSGDTPQKKQALQQMHDKCAWTCLISGWPPHQHCHSNSNSTQSYPSSGSLTGRRPLQQAGVPSLLYARPPMTPARGSETTSRTTQMHSAPHNPDVSDVNTIHYQNIWCEIDVKGP